MRTVLTVLAAAALLAASPAPASGASSGSSTPAPVLKVSTHSGAVPLSLEVKGDLTALPAGDLKACRVRVDRVYVAPSGIRLDERTEHPCGPRAGEAPASQTFKKTIVLKEPGDYALRIILTPAEGREIAGMTQDVKVYSPLEVGGKVTRSE